MGREIDSVDRLDRQMAGTVKSNIQKHQETQEMYRKMMLDSVRGLTKTEIRTKFLNAEYGKDYRSNQDGGYQAFVKAWKNMTLAFADEFNTDEKEQIKARLIAKYNHCFAVQMERDQIKDAVKTLNSMAHVCGLWDPSAVVPAVNILNKNENGEITISFGLNEEQLK